MVTGVQEVIPYCCPWTFSGEENKAHSTSQPLFCSENTHAMIEAGQSLLALQQLASNSNSANFNYNINRISKVFKYFTTTMPTFDGKSEKVEFSTDMFQTSLKIRNQFTEEDQTNYSDSLVRGDAHQTFKNMNNPCRENLATILTVLCGKNLKL